MEFIYGSDTLKNFNDGKVTIKEVAAHFGKMLGIEIKDPSGCYVNMRERVQESRTTYIDSMRDALLEGWTRTTRNCTGGKSNLLFPPACFEGFSPSYPIPTDGRGRDRS